MKVIQKSWQDVRNGQNLDIYITVIIAVIVTVLGIIGVVNYEIISSAILATLALVSISVLQSRYENKEVRNLLSQIDSTRNLAEKFLTREYDRSRIPVLIRNSRKIYLWGFDLNTILTSSKYAIEQSLQNGLEVHFLLLKRYSKAVDMAAFINRSGDASRLNSSLKRSLETLKDLAEKTPPGIIEVREVDFLPPWTIFVSDPHLTTGQMLVRLTTFQTPNETRPTFKLSATDDGEWFQSFVEQFESIWKNSQPIDLHETEHS
jgi:hypothetical protein